MHSNNGHAQNKVGAALKAYREAAGLSIGDVAIEVGVDRVWLWRLETQEADWLHRPLDGAPPRQPSRDLIIRIAFALRLTGDEADELLIEAGYAPLWAFSAQAHKTAPTVKGAKGARATAAKPR